MKPKLYFSWPIFESHQGDDDCACSLPTTSNFGIEVYTKANSTDIREKCKVLLQNNNPLHYVLVDVDHQAVIGLQINPSLAVINTPAHEILDFFSQPRDPEDWPQNNSISYQDAQVAIEQFYEAGILRDATIKPVIQSFNTTAAPLESWLYLTRACNLACAHCFVSKDVRRMELETGLQAVDRLFALAKQHGHPEVKIKYAGGEPTMNWDLIPALHQQAKMQAHETGLKLTEVLITNATLLNHERLQFIKDENFRLSISLDGFGAGHDRQRPVRNGNPTFERVFQSIHLALKMGLSPFLIITITRLNLDEVPALVAFALEHRLRLNLNFYRPHSANDPLVPDNTELTLTLRKAMKVIESNLPDYNFMEGLIDRSNFVAPHQHVCGAGRNYLSIDIDGSVLPCHMLTGYNLPGIPLQMLESPRFDNFPNPKIDHRNGCNICEWRYWCGGGCPVHTQSIMGTSNVSSPYCSVYKAVYPELVRLQALQLIQADIDNK
jgi:uncharacterized protein